MSDFLHRREFLGVAAAASLSPALTRTVARDAEAQPERLPPASKPFLTKADEFFDVSRGDPRPWTLQGEAREKARLTPESWRLKIGGDGTADCRRPASPGRWHRA